MGHFLALIIDMKWLLFSADENEHTLFEHVIQKWPWLPGLEARPSCREGVHTTTASSHLLGSISSPLNLVLGNPKEVPLSSLVSWGKIASLSQFSLCYPFHSDMVDLRGWCNICVSTFVLSNYASDWGRGCSQSGTDSSVSHSQRKHLLDTLWPPFIMHHKKLVRFQESQDWNPRFKEDL